MDRQIKDILSVKGAQVFSVSPLTTVIDAVGVMNHHHVGSVLVIEHNELLGIFSERDVLVRVVAASRDPKQTLVRDVMTPQLHTVTPETRIIEVMRIMTRHRCRHIPVIGPEGLLGLVSIGDVTKAIQQNLKQEVRELANYIGGPYLS